MPCIYPYAGRHPRQSGSRGQSPEPWFSRNRDFPRLQQPVPPHPRRSVHLVVVLGLCVVPLEGKCHHTFSSASTFPFVFVALRSLDSAPAGLVMPDLGSVLVDPDCLRNLLAGHFLRHALQRLLPVRNTFL